MAKIVKILGLNCGHCAQKLENEIRKLGTVKRVELNFIKQKKANHLISFLLYLAIGKFL